MRRFELYIWALIFALILGAQSIQQPHATVPAGNGFAATLPLYADQETPAGTINGANLTFTLATPPNPSRSLLLVRNGLLLNEGSDYTLSGNTITFATAADPQSGDSLLAWYRHL